MIMPAVKRIPVSEPVWKALGEMEGAGQTYDELLEDMIERVKKARLDRLEEDVELWENCPDSEYVPLSEIKSLTFEVRVRKTADAYIRAVPEKSRRIIKNVLTGLGENPFPGSGRDKEKLVLRGGREIYRLPIARTFIAF